MRTRFVCGVRRTTLASSPGCRLHPSALGKGRCLKAIASADLSGLRGVRLVRPVKESASFPPVDCEKIDTHLDVVRRSLDHVQFESSMVDLSWLDAPLKHLWPPTNMSSRNVLDRAR